ncbi:MAG TPA: hypothetical protein VMU84_18385 [Thermoanaerobaculia bacterium]|nr:hypothetical protein [Thermoanaerobaculia bacterium]
MKLRFAVALSLSLLALTPLVAQDPPKTEADQTRAKISEALAKGDTATADKILASLTPSTGKAAAIAFNGGLTNYEQIRSCGFYPQETRLECVVEIKQAFGYGGPVGSLGSFEFVAFYVDWQGNGYQPSDYVGSGIVHITDGSAQTNFAVYRDFNPQGGPRTSNGGGNTQTVTNGPTYKARAILQWASPISGPNANPFWGNVFDFQIRMMPIR